MRQLNLLLLGAGESSDAECSSTVPIKTQFFNIFDLDHRFDC